MIAKGIFIPLLSLSELPYFSPWSNAILEHVAVPVPGPVYVFYIENTTESCTRLNHERQTKV